MAKKVAPKNAILLKLKKKGADKAHNKHKSDETVIQEGMNLPAGIEGGVAQLVEAGLFEYTDKDKGPTGEAYARFTGIVKSPTEHDGVKCKGKRCSLFIPLYDTPQSTKKPKLEDHYADLLNEIRKLGVDTEELEFDDIGGTLDELVEEAPYFKFRTWKGEKQKSGPYKDREPRVQEVFLGVCEYEDDDDPDAGVVEDEETEEEEIEEEAEESEVSVGDEGTAPYEGEEFNVVVDAVDGDTLTVHNAEDEDDTWEVEVSDFTPAEASDEEEEEEEDEEEEEAGPPIVGSLMNYDGVEVIVKKVNKKNKTADVEDSDDGGIYEGVEWSELEAT